MEFTGYRHGHRRGDRARHRRGGRGGALGRAPATRSRWCSTARPFYAEGGGQLADQGVIELENGARLEVRDVQSPVTGLIVHQVRVLYGELTAGLGGSRAASTSSVAARSRARTPRRTWSTRRSARRWARPRPRRARRTRRAGSASTSPRPARCRPSVMAGRRGPGQRRGARRPRGARRGDEPGGGRGLRRDGAVRGEVRRPACGSISVGDWARELCGGTHAGSSGKLGVIKLLGESSIGSGVRRVEALVGSDAYRFLAREHVLVDQLSDTLKVRPEQLPERVNDIVEKLRAAEKEIEKVRLAPAARGRRRARGRSGEGRPGQPGGPPRRRRRRRRRPHARARRAGPAAAGGARCRGRSIGAADGKVAVVAALNDEARARGAQRQRAGPRGRSAGRRQGRRQGRRRPGRWHRRLPDRRGRGAGRRRGRPRSAAG